MSVRQSAAPPLAPPEHPTTQALPRLQHRDSDARVVQGTGSSNSCRTGANDQNLHQGLIACWFMRHQPHRRGEGGKPLTQMEAVDAFRNFLDLAHKEPSDEDRMTEQILGVKAPGRPRRRAGEMSSEEFRGQLTESHVIGRQPWM
jgi:hypothetical protein